MNENTNWLLIIIGAIAAFFSFRWFLKILGMSDGQKGFSFKDFKNVIALAFFLWAAIYLIVKEANRPANSDHIFSEFWVAFVICGLLYVLSMEYAFDKIAEVLKLLIELRVKRSSITHETSQTTTTTGKPEQEA